MNESIYRARRELFQRADIPVSRADLRLLRWKQRLRLILWEGMLRSLLVVKRAIDLVVSIAAVILFLPVFLIVAVCIVMEDGFPVIYAQKRVGINGQEFLFFKFRSMCKGADSMKSDLMDRNETKSGLTFKMKQDPRVLRCGRLFRRFSLDELPQFFNVIAGDLSLVGPRPPLPDEVKQYSLHERKRLHVKPGITCLWQVKGRSDIPFDQQVGLDMQYIQSQSILKDLAILIKTIPAVLLGRGAY